VFSQGVNANDRWRPSHQKPMDVEILVETELDRLVLATRGPAV
jgi:hypothetical protein